MDVIEVANVGVENIRVADKGVAHVDDRNEIPAATEPREERFTEAQREPADSETKPAAEETDKSGTIDGIAAVRTRAPAPPAAKIIPTAVMVRRETPGRIVNPGPAPRADPVPIAVAVGSPVRRNFALIPNEAIFRLIAPVTVIIQIAVAGRIARNVLSGNGVVFFQVALGGPTIEAVRTGSPVNVVLDVVRAVEFGALPGMNFIGLAAGSYFTFTANCGNASRVAVFIDVNAKSARFLDGESQIRRVHFVEIALTKFADAEIDAAFRKAHLRDALVKVQERQRGHAAEVNGCWAGLQFREWILVDPNLVADGHGAVS